MKITAIGYRVLSRIMTNSDMMETVDRQNPHVSAVRKGAYFRAVRTLSSSGASSGIGLPLAQHRRGVRRWLLSPGMPAR